MPIEVEAGGSPATSGSPETIIALDALRAIAAMTVAFEHVRGQMFIPWFAVDPSQKNALTSAFFLVTRMGHEAVMVFFVLSGYLVGGPLIERTRSGGLQPINYFVDRFCRIFIPLIPACVLAALVGHLVTGVHESPVNILVSALALNDIIAPTSQYNPPLWSVSFEVWFYILAGFLAIAIGKQRSLLGYFGVAIATLVFTRLDAVFILFWVTGALTYSLRDKFERWEWFLLGLILAIVFAAVFETNKASGDVLNKAQVVYAQAIMCVGVSLMLPYLCTEGVNRSLRPFEWLAINLAKFSYSMYLFHFPLLMIIMHYFTPMEVLGPREILTYLAVTIVMIALTWPFYFVFERRTGAIRKYLKVSLLKLSKPAAAELVPNNLKH